jgi:hypothetical protein
VNKIEAVHCFYSLNHLRSGKKNGSHFPFTTAKWEQFLKTWSKNINNHYVVVSFNAKKMKASKTRMSLKLFIKLSFILQLWWLELFVFFISSNFFKFNSYFLISLEVNPLVDNSKSTWAKLLAYFVFSSNPNFHNFEL